MKNKILTAVILIVLAGLFLIWKGQSPSATNQPKPTPTQDNSQPRIVSTKPDPLDNAIIPADQVIEITFNKPLQNTGEFKVKIDPKVDFKLELSPDRKTGKIEFAKPLDLGTEYTLSIGPDTKFDGTNNWGQSPSFHFRTIKYSGV